MARLVGTVCTSHIPAIGHAIARGLEQDAYWLPFFAGYPRAREWLATADPDVAIVVYNDHGLNFFLDKMPTFAVGAAREYRNADEGWGLPTTAPYRGRPRAVLAHHRIAGRRRVRRHILPGDVGGPRVHRAACVTVARPLPTRTPNRTGLPEHDSTPAALADALLQARPSHRPRHRVLSRGAACRRHRHGRPITSARRPTRGIHQQRIRSHVPREDRQPTLSRSPPTRFETSCGWQVRKASRSSRGSSRAVRSTTTRQRSTATTTYPYPIPQPG